MNEHSRQTKIYGIHPVEELIAARPDSIERIYFESGRKTPALFSLLKTCRKKRIQVQHIPGHKLGQIAAGAKHQGVLAIASPKSLLTIDALRERLATLDHAPLLLVPASVEDPHNLGAIIRTAAAFAVDAILLERRNTVALSEAVAKASAGALEHMPMVKPRNLEAIIGQFASEGFMIAGARGEAPTPSHQLDYTGPTLLIVGGEHRAIPPYLRKLCTADIAIPMTGAVQSLNVSTAAAILLYEISRQRAFARCTPM
jgi:23S rRNA (guanosine2251-2'-O)-methyltransferase